DVRAPRLAERGRRHHPRPRGDDRREDRHLRLRPADGRRHRGQVLRVRVGDRGASVMKVTVVGAGFYGSTLVQRIAGRGYADEVVMTDIIEDKPQGLALDMLQSRPIEGFETRIIGTNGYAETEGSDVCVITAGLPRKPGMSRMDLLEKNAQIVADVTRKLVAGSPDAVIVVVSNPLDEMTALCAEVSGFPRHRVMGQAG